MRPVLPWRRQSLLIPTGCVGFGLLVLLLLPAGVTVMNDDFGYLASVLDTVRHGRPWTDAWLEPWAASFSTLCAVVWKLTGSFLVATQGVQAACSAAAAVAACLIFRAFNVSAGRSLGLAILLLTMPALLWKQLEFTAVALYLPCLLWAIWAALHDRWRIFFVAWLLAFASRQSAAVWLALPAWAVARAWLADGRTTGSWRAPAWVVAGALPAGLLLHLGMNESHAQAMLTTHTWERVQWPLTVRNGLFGLTAWLVAAGWGALVQAGWGSGRSFSPVTPRRVLVLLAVVTVGVGLFAGYFSPIYFEHEGYAGWRGQWYAAGTLAVGAAGWLLAPGSVRPGFALAGLGALGLVALRTDTWDYYYLDVALFGFAAVNVPAVATEQPAGRVGQWLGLLGLALLAAYHGQATWELKCRVDREYAIAVLTEQALRADRLAVTDISYAPYGLSGWLLHQHYISHEGRGDVNVGAFTRYVRRHAATIQYGPMRFWRDSQTLARWRDLDESRLVNDGVFRVGWIWYQRIGILRSSVEEIGPADIARPDPDIRRRLLPLDDAEWRAALGASGG